MMNSKYDGWCSDCKQKINKGDPIQKNSKGKWVHVTHPVKLSVADALHYQSKSASPLSGRNIPQQVETVGDVEISANFSISWTPSVYQEKIFTFIRDGKGNGVVEAVAGSGKTSTIVKALEIVPKGKRVAFLAFNKHIAKELRARAPEGIYVSTIHSLGLSICKKLQNFKDVDQDDKVGNIMEGFWPITKSAVPNQTERKMNFMKRGLLRKIVALSKATLVDYNDNTAVMKMLEHYGIDTGEDDNLDIMEVLAQLPFTMKSCLEQTDYIDYDDMIWMPVADERLRRHFEKFDYLFVDEAQDLNNCQIEFIKNSVYDYSRVICVGDRRQSLYGFRGADVEAIPRLIRELEATVLPLSITYRCPASHVRLAQGLVPQIEASPSAKEGKVETVSYLMFQKTIEAGDMVICRTNAPLVKPAFEAIRQGKKAIIRGKDIGAELVKFVERFETDDLGQLEVMMAQYTEREYNRLMDKGKELQAENAMDKFNTIKSVSNECKNVSELMTRLNMLFSDSNVGIVFSSVHRAKGLEANRVFILHRELMPHPKAKQEWEKVQEENTLYVALTRSKDELYFVKGENE